MNDQWTVIILFFATILVFMSRFFGIIPLIIAAILLTPVLLMRTRLFDKLAYKLFTAVEHVKEKLHHTTTVLQASSHPRLRFATVEVFPSKTLEDLEMEVQRRGDRVFREEFLKNGLLLRALLRHKIPFAVIIASSRDGGALNQRLLILTWVREEQGADRKLSEQVRQIASLVAAVRDDVSVRVNMKPPIFFLAVEDHHQPEQTSLSESKDSSAYSGAPAVYSAKTA